MVQATRALAAPRAPAPAGGDGLTFCRTAMDEAELHCFRRTDPNLHPQLKLSCRLMATPPGQAEPSSVTIEQESSEEGSELVVRVEREHVCNMLVRTNDDNRPLLPVDTA